MATLAIVCDNCGAKYRIPEEDERSTAKCQKCGSVIDVNGQRSTAAAAARAAARPAVARPAKDRSKEPAPTTAPKPALGQRSSERARRSERTERTGRGTRQSSSKAPAKRPWWPWIVGGVIVLAVILFFVLRK